MVANEKEFSKLEYTQSAGAVKYIDCTSADE